MSDSLTIQSHKGPYSVRFDDDAIADLGRAPPENAHFVIDRQVAELYTGSIERVLDGPSVLIIEATEDAKSLDRFPSYVNHLVERRVRRGDVLIAIGGGIIQDITCFLAATLLRGIDWRFYPTTLLAQADSCIGSKSSINAGMAKNILGTFTPPREVYLCTQFLNTLDQRDVCSGIGEILKIHAIAGASAFNQVANDYQLLTESRKTLLGYIQAALKIKKSYIEVDEFDRSARNVLNYGHSFGHALEAATEFKIPHGIAVTIGMDMANYTAYRLTNAPHACFNHMHTTLRANYRGFEGLPVPQDAFFAALSKDKKNVGADLTLIQPDANGRITKRIQPFDNHFREVCVDYLERVRAFGPDSTGQ